MRQAASALSFCLCPDVVSPRILASCACTVLFHFLHIIVLEGGGVQSLAGLGVFRSAYGRDFCRSLWNLSSSLVLVSLPWRLSCIVATFCFA
jgi:hypothetical protein